MKYGYSFHWPAAQNPYFITPDGKIIELHVRDDIPYLDPGDTLCAPREPKDWVYVPTAHACAAQGHTPDAVVWMDEEHLHKWIDPPDVSDVPQTVDYPWDGVIMADDVAVLYADIPDGPRDMIFTAHDAWMNQIEACVVVDAVRYGTLSSENAHRWPDVCRLTASTLSGVIIRDIWIAHRYDGKPASLPEDPAAPGPEVPAVPDPVADAEAEAAAKKAKDAAELRHALTHDTKDPNCDACKRGIMKNKRYKRGSYNRDPTEWGGGGNL